MRRKKTRPIIPVLIVLNLVLFACGALAAEPTPTSTPQPTATKTLVPTATFTPTKTPRPTRTPDFTATQLIENYNAEVQKYFELGYLETTEGKVTQYSDFNEEWAQLDWYKSWSFSSTQVENFFISAHLKWSSAYRNAATSGCGFYFAFRQGSDFRYTVFLDRSKVHFLVADYFSGPFSPTRGSGLVNFNNPADQPVEADFTLIVQGAYAYVLVNDEVVGEYTLSQSKILRGYFGASILSGTNKGFGTRCEMTNVHAWIPD